MFGGIANGIFMNDLYTVFLAKDEAKNEKNGTTSRGGNSKSFRGRTKRFDITGSVAPSPRYGHLRCRKAESCEFTMAIAWRKQAGVKAYFRR